jgi:hypothetical protein
MGLLKSKSNSKKSPGEKGFLKLLSGKGSVRKAVPGRKAEKGLIM